MMHNVFQRKDLLSYDGRGKLSSLKSKVQQGPLFLGLQAKYLLNHFNFFWCLPNDKKTLQL